MGCAVGVDSLCGKICENTPLETRGERMGKEAFSLTPSRTATELWVHIQTSLISSKNKSRMYFNTIIPSASNKRCAHWHAFATYLREKDAQPIDHLPLCLVPPFFPHLWRVFMPWGGTAVYCCDSTIYWLNKPGKHLWDSTVLTVQACT